MKRTIEDTVNKKDGTIITEKTVTVERTGTLYQSRGDYGPGRFYIKYNDGVCILLDDSISDALRHTGVKLNGSEDNCTITYSISVSLKHKTE